MRNDVCNDRSGGKQHGSFPNCRVLYSAVSYADIRKALFQRIFDNGAIMFAELCNSSGNDDKVNVENFQEVFQGIRRFSRGILHDVEYERVFFPISFPMCAKRRGTSVGRQDFSPFLSRRFNVFLMAFIEITLSK